MNPSKIVLIALLFVVLPGAGQSSAPSDTSEDTTAFSAVDSSDILLSQQRLPIRLELNVINNKAGLARIAAKLKGQLTGKRTTVSIVHIGDSHLQAGLVSAPVRAWLQKRFGNAGRGMVFPYRVIKSNGPMDYSFSRTGSWTGHNLLRRNGSPDSLSAGISGFAARSTDSNATLGIRVSDPGDRFNTIQVFAENSPTAVFCAGNRRSSGSTAGSYPWLQVLSLDSLSDSATITVCPQKEASPRDSGAFATEGMVLLNGQPGVLYHAIGVNGAQVEDFVNARMLWEQMHALRPDLVIISLGTNNAYELSFDSATFRQSLDSLRACVSLAAPGCDLLITTVNDHDFKKKRYVTRMVTRKNGTKVQRTYPVTTYAHNPRTAPCNRALMEFSGKYSIAYWDIFEIMGGEGSIKTWVKQGAATHDHLHFTQTGYKILGTLFQRALESAVDR
jgi:lysophospholipase L1-like esterase